MTLAGRQSRCLVCGEQFQEPGREDRAFCGARCKQRAGRLRAKGAPLPREPQREPVILRSIPKWIRRGLAP